MGLITPGGEGAERADAVRTSLDCMRHRGPDESGTWHDDDVVLGFNRLSIIDVEGSHQPLTYASDRYRIVFNGEIYNYVELREELGRDHGVRFATEGDTEAIVAAYDVWGRDAVRRLRGMFAFLIWDTHERVLFGARDPFGIKPLFLAAGPHGVAFASEKKSLLEFATALGEPTTAPDPVALQHYLQLQYVPEPLTLHRAIRRIESGTSFTVTPGEPIATERYFVPQFDARVGGDRLDDEERLHGEITEVLRDSVAKHMRADVTVGAFLSGGVDSTAIAALAPTSSPSPPASSARATPRSTSRRSRPRPSGCGTWSARSTPRR
jgi:asparagine synthase (glutamine-hydrolysing)